MVDRNGFKRMLRGRSQKDLGDALGIDQSAVTRIKSGERRVLIDEAVKISDHTGAPLSEVMDVLGVEGPKNRESPAPIIGYVVTGARIVSLILAAEGVEKSVDTVAIPAGVDPVGRIAALRVNGETNFPFEDGWLFFYNEDDQGLPGDFLGKLCVVEIAETGEKFVKKILAGSLPGLYTLQSWSTPPVYDVKIASARPVFSIVPV